MRRGEVEKWVDGIVDWFGRASEMRKQVRI